MTLGDMLFGSIIVRNARNPALTRKALQAILKTEKGRTISIVQPLGVKLQAGEKNLDHALQHPLRQALSRGTAAVPRDGTQHLLKHAYRVTRPSR